MTKIAVIAGFLGQTRDRFCLYNEVRSPKEKLEAAAEIEGINGVEIIYPYDCQGIELAETLRRLGLGVAAVNVNVKGEPEFAFGSLTSPDPNLRARAVALIKEGMDLARHLGCGRVTVCPLSDGHEYAFQGDYQEEWRRMRDAFAEAAAYAPDVTLSLEYKPSETRVFSTLPNLSAVILMIKEIGLPNLGVTFDIGHSLYAGEHPAQALAMLYYHGLKPYIHVNDNYRNWDWDLIAGAINFWDLLEVVWTARHYGYDDWWTFDVMPARMDPRSCFATSAKLLKAIFAAAKRIDAKELERLRAATRGERVPRILTYLWRAVGIEIAEEKE
ncbi:MAG: sugar phosphate isomerase/epimerase [Firmicutes bacterium]|nr:sugar phosphate isomerase/epimerase [Bacillota bacterium]